MLYGLENLLLYTHKQWATPWLDKVAESSCIRALPVPTVSSCSCQSRCRKQTGELWSWDTFSQGKSIRNLKHCLNYVKWNLRSILGKSFNAYEAQTSQLQDCLPCSHSLATDLFVPHFFSRAPPGTYDFL